VPASESVPEWGASEFKMLDRYHDKAVSINERESTCQKEASRIPHSTPP
jgi:hypothetical protein